MHVFFVARGEEKGKSLANANYM